MEMDKELEQKLEDAVWAARSLFERGKTSGSSANMSFYHEGKSMSAPAEPALAL